MGVSPVSPIRSTRTVCPFCSCGCGLYLTGTSQDIEGVGPSEHHPISQGRLCARGWSAHEASLWGPRLRTPLVRAGGALRPAGWEEALAAAVDGLKQLRDGQRPLGVLGSGRATNEESFLALALARAALGTPHLDAPLRAPWDALLRGLGPGLARPDSGRVLPALERAGLVVVLEDDLALSHPRVALSVLRAVRRGARLVTIGWQRTTLAELATPHVPLEPSAPLATLAGLRALSGMEALLGAARRPAFVLAPFDADPALLEGAAQEVARLAGALQDALLLPLPVRANTRGALDMGVAPDRLPGRRALDDADARAALSRLWGGAGCWDAGVAADEMPAAVAGLVVLGEDLPAVHPAPAAVRAQLAALEHLVVLDSFLTETAAAAHVVLPIAAFGEGEGSLTGVEDRAQAVRPLHAPPAEARPGWQVLAELLERLGCGFQPRSLDAVCGAIATAVPGYATLSGPPADDGWAVAWAGETAGANGRPATRAPAEAAALSTGTLLLRRAGAFEWGQDPLVRFSPTLRRIPVSQARRFPDGLVAISASDAAMLKVREGWTVRLRSARGETRAAVTLRAGLEPGLLLVPYAFREQLATVLGADGVAEVEVQPA